MINFLAPKAPPILHAWVWIIIFWPVSDVLRKWTGFNQPLYILQVITPFLLLVYLYNKKALRLEASICGPALFIAITTAVQAIYRAISEYGISYIGVWFLSLSALIGPPLLICSCYRSTDSSWQFKRNSANTLVFASSLLLLLNSILSVVQSVVGRSHFLSVGAGGAFDAQIATNTDIELRAPGLFTFVNGSANYSALVLLFLFSSFFFAADRQVRLLRAFALLSIPVAVIRSISRTFLAIVIVISLPYITLFKRLQPLILLSLFLAVVFVLFPGFGDLIFEGLQNFFRRIDDSSGIQVGIIQRFFYSFVTDAGGSQRSIFLRLPEWLASDPLSALFGYGLGYSSPLFRLVSGSDSVAYGAIDLKDYSIVLGENAFTSLVADVGLIGLLAYGFLLFSLIKIYLRKFPVGLFASARKLNLSAFLALLLAYSVVYFRPANLLFSCGVALLPLVCQFLFVHAIALRPIALRRMVVEPIAPI